MQSEILAYQVKQSFPKEQHEGGGQEAVTSRHGTIKNLERSCSGNGSNGKIEIEEKDGDLPVIVHGSLWLEVEEDLSTLATQYWAEGVLDGKMVSGAKRSLDETGSGSSDVEAGKRTCRSSDV